MKIVQPFFSALGVFKRALILVWRSHPWLTTMSVVLSLVQAFLPFGIFYLTKLVIDQLISSVGSADFSSENLLYYLLGLGAIWLAEGLIGIAQQWVNERHTILFTDTISAMIQAKSIQLDYGYFENPDYKDTLHRVQYESMSKPLQVLQDTQKLIAAAFFLVLVMAFIFSLAWWLVPVLLLAALPGVIAKFYIATRQYELARRRTQFERESWIINSILTMEYAARELRLYNFGAYFMERYRRIRQQLFTDQSRLGNRKASYEIIGQVSEVSAVTALIAWAAFRAKAGLISVGSLVMYLQAFQRGQQQLRQAFAAITGLYSHRLFLNHLFEFLDLQPALPEVEKSTVVPASTGKGIMIDNVSFHYPSQNKMVLQDINLEFKKGEKIALVGPNGSGKSTLIKLLARFYDPDTGSILIDNTDIRLLKKAELRNKIGIVFQDYVHYPFTVKENIGISDIGDGINEERLKKAAGQTQAAAHIESLPHQYDSYLGYTFSGGVELSGGQWQQVAIARAFYADKEILILDEPMSAIDPLIEQQIHEEIYKMGDNKIILFVTHRLYHLQKADKIVVMENGRVTEVGNFSELMERRGLFYRLFKSQQEG